MANENALAVLGITDEEERAYHAIAGMAVMGLDDIAAYWTDLVATRVEARALLDRLEGLGLVDVVLGRPNLYRAARASQVLERLALAQEGALLGARAEIEALVRLQADTAEDTTPGELLEVIQGRDAVFEQSQLLGAAAKEQLRCIDKPPYAERVESLESPAEAGRLQAGISIRVVYDSSSFDLQGRVRSIEDAVSLGERARVMNEAPVKLLICDDRIALLPFRPSTAVESALLVHPCALLDALIALFEKCWTTATPIGSSGSPPGEPETKDAREILTLMAIGMPDRAIARHLGVGYRTVQRRVSELIAEMQVSSPFELALVAVGSGWVSPRPRQPTPAPEHTRAAAVGD